MKTTFIFAFLIFCPLTRLVTSEKMPPAITTQAYYQIDEAKMEITLCIKNAGGPFCLVERIDAMGNRRRLYLEPTNSKNEGFSVNPVVEHGPTIAGKSRRLLDIQQFMPTHDETAPVGPSIYISTYKTSPGPTSRALLTKLAVGKPDLVGKFNVRKIREIPDTGEILLAPAIEAKIVLSITRVARLVRFWKVKPTPKSDRRLSKNPRANQ